jgi:hypothetical protein
VAFLPHPYKEQVAESVDCWVCEDCGLIDLVRKRGETPPMRNRFKGGTLGIEAIARHIHEG